MLNFSVKNAFMRVNLHKYALWYEISPKLHGFNAWCVCTQGLLIGFMWFGYKCQHKYATLGMFPPELFLVRNVFLYFVVKQSLQQLQ